MLKIFIIDSLKTAWFGWFRHASFCWTPRNGSWIRPENLLFSFWVFPACEDFETRYSPVFQTSNSMTRSHINSQCLLNPHSYQFCAFYQKRIHRAWEFLCFPADCTLLMIFFGFPSTTDVFIGLVFLWSEAESWSQLLSLANFCRSNRSLWGMNRLSIAFFADCGLFLLEFACKTYLPKADWFVWGTWCTVFVFSGLRLLDSP